MKSISTNGSGAIQIPAWKIMKLHPYNHIKYEGTIDPNVRAKIIKLHNLR